MESQDKRKNSVNAGVAGAQAEAFQRYGEATRQHVIAYTGKDNQTGVTSAKGLEEISKSKINPDYYDTNIKQQAGFSAEVKTVARENAQKTLKGERATKSIRTDDMFRQADGHGHTVGGTNEQLYDIAEVDNAGVYIEGSARQLKFVGGTPKECAQKLLTKKFDKYRDADVPIEVPSDFYEEVRADLSTRSDNLKSQIECAEKNGKQELAAQKQKQLEKIDKTRASLRRGSVSNEEAIEARLHPKLSTAKDMAKISHQAGLNAAKAGAVIGGGMSFISNTVAVIKGDKSAGDAVLSVAGDTATAAATSYITGFSSSELAGILGNAPSSCLQTLSKTNLPATVIAAAFGVGKTLVRWGSGEINATDCLAELGETGTSMLASSAGAVVGQAIIPIPIVGGLIGGMVGYAMTSAYYGNLVASLKEAKLAHKERLIIEAECTASIAALREYRLQIDLSTANYLRESRDVFTAAFAQMESAYNIGDANAFIAGTNLITERLNGKALFEDKDDFDQIMCSSKPIVL